MYKSVKTMKPYIQPQTESVTIHSAMLCVSSELKVASTTYSVKDAR